MIGLLACDNVSRSIMSDGRDRFKLQLINNWNHIYPHLFPAGRSIINSALAPKKQCNISSFFFSTGDPGCIVRLSTISVSTRSLPRFPPYLLLGVRSGAVREMRASPWSSLQLRAHQNPSPSTVSMPMVPTKCNHRFRPLAYIFSQ